MHDFSCYRLPRPLRILPLMGASVCFIYRGAKVLSLKIVDILPDVSWILTAAEGVSIKRDPRHLFDSLHEFVLYITNM